MLKSIVAKEIVFCTITDKYIDFLRTTEPKEDNVLFNKSFSTNDSRKYIGVLLDFGDYKYFAPLSSPKEKHKYMNNKTPDVNVCVDNIKIHQVFRNLLNNAINHSHDGEKIKINSNFVNGDIRIEVCNKGDPIPEEERTLIWERYHRAQHQGGRKQGTGLGLSIVKTICDAHNMTYGTDYIDENNVFWFQIPKKRIVFSQSV